MKAVGALVVAKPPIEVAGDPDEAVPPIEVAEDPDEAVVGVGMASHLTNYT
ncbi:hypothetical protein CRG98_003030 [Punica granatum]|uniref:Uncharacterized protein n=1 Tax=Punica granatum TaxID=22663 RepID=A0A2I0L7A9_PUNGR|nr:hypothetical protein CRG98_003030 [Punica granatum]